MIVRTGRTSDTIAKVLTKAEEMNNSGVKYDTTDALSSMLGMNDVDEKKVNCGDFVNECFKQTGVYEGATRD